MKNKRKEKNNSLIRAFLRLDDNLLSFLCGIISNIPITFALGFLAIGSNVFEILRFGFTMLGLFLSVLITVLAFSMTIRKLAIQKKIDQGRGNQEKEELFNKYYAENKAFFTRKLTGIVIFSILLVCVLTFLWINSNYC